MGWDGRPYSYSIKDNTVSNFTPLGVDEQKKAIERISNGKITVNETIYNPGTLAAIYRSIKRMNDNGNGNLIPDHVVIGDPEPGSVTIFGGSGVLGTTEANGGTKKNPDYIELYGADYPDVQSRKVGRAYSIGWFPTNSGDQIAQHELSHASEHALMYSPYRYYRQMADDNQKYANKYSASDLWKDAINNIKYAIPLLSDAIFGTHLRPSKEEVDAMFDSKNDSIIEVAEFWDDYYTPLEDKYKTVEQKKDDEAADKGDTWLRKYDSPRGNGIQNDLFEKAAKNVGFDSVDDAIASISTYATYNKSEAFAEAS